MLQKTFQIVLVTFLVIFTAAGAILLASGLMTLLMPHTGGGAIVFAGGISSSLLKLILLALLIATVAIVAFVTGRKKLSKQG